jgi:hypothetical protein
MSEYTKGPWSVECMWFVRTDGCTIAEVRSANTPIGAANAQLISAAPDLVEALQDAVRLLDRAPMIYPYNNESDDVRVKARAALKKAGVL